MCGLVGIAGNLLFQDEFTMKRLLLFDFFRGEHSTGMAAIRTGGQAVIAKIDSNPINLFDMGQFKTALNGSASRAFIGHNRQATRGAVNTANAHPFQVDHIIGAHNGTLDYQSVKRLEDELGEKYAVDSLALIAGIAKLGVEKTIKLCTEGKDSKEGAWAIVWYNQEEGSLNFLRNKHRPLFYAFEEGFKRMFWASEWWMIREAMDESTNKYKQYSEKKDGKNVGFFVFEPDVHYKFDLASLCAGSAKRPKPKSKKIKGREVVVQSAVVPFEHPMGFQIRDRGKAQQTNGTYMQTVGSPNSQKTSGSGSTQTSSTKIRSTEPRKCIQLIGVPAHPYANIIQQMQFEQIAHNGCSWCSKTVKYGDLGITIFERDGRMLCKECTGNRDPNNPKPFVRIHVPAATIDALS